MQAAEYQTLLRHMEWADATVWRTVLSLTAAKNDAPLLGRLHHLHTVQWLYLQVWRGEPIKVLELSSFTDLAALAAWAQPYYSELRSFAAGLPEQALGGQVEFPWVTEIVKRFGSAGPATLGESVMQVVLHSTYHRGQIATRLRELGADPPLTDFIAWAWRGRPEPEWK